MSYFICVVPVCPVRADASHRSEQVSQLLFGEECELIEEGDDFFKVKFVYDGYEGWCQKGQLKLIQELTHANNIKLAAGWMNELELNGTKMFVPFGSVISGSSVIANDDSMLKYTGSTLDPNAELFTAETIKKFAFTFLNTSYQWGGRSVFGIDCSGFSQLVYKCMNIHLLRDASEQATQGDDVGFLMEAQPGDLAFFDNAAGKITHVGILLDAATIIHASAKVRIDAIDNFGIVNNETGKRTHNLRVIKRMASLT